MLLKKEIGFQNYELTGDTDDSTPEASPTASSPRGYTPRGISQDYLWVSAAVESQQCCKYSVPNSSRRDEGQLCTKALD